MNFVNLGGSMEPRHSPPSAMRRHTIVGHNTRPSLFELLGSSVAHGGESNPRLSEIHLADFSHNKDRRGHARTPSNVTDKSCNNSSNHRNYAAHGEGAPLQGDEDIHHLQKPLLLTSKHVLPVHEEEGRASSYGRCIVEHLPLNHDCQAEGCERITINVSGLKFETQLRTLERLPNTLLGDPNKRKRYWDESRKEYFFDRHRLTFPAILYYYQSGGRLKKPLEVPMDIFLNELNFYEIGLAAIDCFKTNEGYITDPPEAKMPQPGWKRRLFNTLEYPESSMAAKIFAFFSVIAILVSVVTFCVETLPQFKNSGCKNITVENSDGVLVEISVLDYTDPLFVIESCCIAFFSVEIILRFMVSPSKVHFLKMSINWIDLVSIAPYFVLLIVNSQTNVCGAGGSPTGSGLSVLRVLRVVRILKLSKHSEGLKILGKTMKTSIRELSMFILFLGIATVIYAGAIFYLEMGQEQSMFTSIPDAFWWAIVTMTTVGYGDYVPVGPAGKILGSFCVLSGVLAIALPVPVIVANFNNFYRHYTGDDYEVSSCCDCHSVSVTGHVRICCNYREAKPGVLPLPAAAVACEELLHCQTGIGSGVGWLLS